MTGPAEEPSRSVLPPLVAELWKKLKKAGRALGPGIPDEEYHEVRILAKRARYVAESVATALDALGKDAGRFARRAADVQDVLGEHHDALIARGMLESAASERPQDGPFGLAAGRMIERQAFAAEQARARFRDAWDRLDRKKMRRWMKSSGG